MSSGATSVGAVSVELQGDAKPVVDAFAKVDDKLKDFEQEATKAASAAGKVSSRVDELRLKQGQLTKALVEAAAATDRDEGKVHALRLELEQATGALNRLTGAQQVNLGANSKAATALRATATATTAVQGSSRNSGAAILELSRGLEDLQYGIGGVLNNIPNLVQMLGMGAGVAGVISLVAVGVTQLVKHWDDFGDAAADTSFIETAKSRVGELRGEISELARELRSLQTGISGQRLGTAAEVQTATTDASKALEMIPGGRVRFDLLMEVTKGDTALLPGYGNYTSINRDQYVSPEAFDKAKAAIDVLSLSTEKYNELLKIETERKEQAAVDAAVDGANAQEEAHRRDADKAARAAEHEMTRSQEYDAVKSMFAGIAADGTKSTASWANPTVSPEQLNFETGMQSEAEQVLVTWSHTMNATADEIDAMNAGFMSAGDAAIDLRSPLERFGDALSDINFADLGAGVAAATVSGGFSSGGAVAGTAVGGVIDVATGGATGGLGAVLGGIIGGILGNVLDELIDVLGILTPLFDAIAVIIAALAPVFVVIGVLITSLAGTIVALVPLIAALAEPVAAVLLVIVRLVGAVLPFINILVVVVGALVAFVLELIMIGAQKLDEGLRLMVSGALWLYNGFIDVYNGLIRLIRTIPGFGDFGVTMASVSTHVGDVMSNFGKSLKDITGVMDGAAEATAEYGASQENVPQGYRIPFYDAETPNGRGDGSPRRSMQQMIINGNVTVMAASANIMEAIRAGVMQRRGSNQGRSGGGDESN